MFQPSVKSFYAVEFKTSAVRFKCLASGMCHATDLRICCRFNGIGSHLNNVGLNLKTSLLGSTWQDRPRAQCTFKNIAVKVQRLDESKCRNQLGASAVRFNPVPRGRQAFFYLKHQQRFNLPH